MSKKKIEEIIEEDVSDFFTNLVENKPNFIRMKSFIEGVIARETNEKTKQEMRNTLEELEMYEGVASVLIQLIKKQDGLKKQIEEIKHETEKNHNNNLAKIIELDKGLDKLQKKMDR